MMQNIVKLLLLGILFSSSVNAAQVELLNAFNIDSSRYGQTSHLENFTVVTDALSDDQTVFVRHEKTDGTWVNIPMYYHGPAGSNKKLWKLYITGNNLSPNFVVGTTTAGITYWDNNNGQNYRPNSPGYLLGKNSNLSLDNFYIQQSATYRQRLTGTIAVKNLAPTKKIKLIYTQDNWRSSTTVDARFSGSYVIYGYGSYLNPNANNVETWDFSTEIPAGLRGEFYLSYEANGRIYYDNNFGLNYRFNLDNYYGSMNLRTGPDWQPGRPMTLIDNNLWAVNLYVNGVQNEIKFDAYNDWLIDFGDNNNDGFAEYKGTNIRLPSTQGEYQILFNESTGRYSFRPLSVTP